MVVFTFLWWRSPEEPPILVALTTKPAPVCVLEEDWLKAEAVFALQGPGKVMQMFGCIMLPSDSEVYVWESGTPSRVQVAGPREDPLVVYIDPSAMIILGVAD